MTTLVLNDSEWNKIYHRIRDDYGDAVILISWRLKEELGFTVRRHRNFDTVKGYTYHDIRLDFVNQESLTFFNLKYGHRDGQ